MKKYFLTITHILLVTFLVCVGVTLYLLLTKYPMFYIISSGIFTIIIGIGIYALFILASFEV